MQVPGDEDPHCTETLPSIGVNILDYPPEVKPLMDSRNYQQLLPPVWQQVDNDNNNPGSTTTNWAQATSSNCKVTVTVCGFTAGPQDNWLITQHISRMVNGTALQQVTVQVDFIMNTCNIQNNCRRAFAIHKYETSTINTTAAKNLSNYEFVDQIVPRNGSGSVRENGSVNINFATEVTGFYLGIQDETSCIVIHRVLVFYYVCPAVTSDLITHPETIAPIIGASTPVQVVGNCVESARPQSGATPYLTCSQKGVWTVNVGAGCVCNPGFQSSSDGHSCVVCDAETYGTGGTCLPCPANSNSTQSGESVCPCFEGYYRAAGEPPKMACTQPPSAPHNLQVLQVTNTTVQLRWDLPVSNGGRDDPEYQLSYQIATSSEPATIYGRVNMTEGVITGLRPFTQYVVFVSSENGVSAQDSDINGRTVSVNITTLEGDEFCSCEFVGSFPAGSVSPATVPSTVAVIAIILIIILLCAYMHLRIKLYKISKIAANDSPEYATVETNQQAVQNGIVSETGMQSVEPHSTSIQAEENIAYETGMQSMGIIPNIAYSPAMQGHNLHAHEHNTSL